MARDSARFVTSPSFRIPLTKLKDLVIGAQLTKVGFLPGGAGGGSLRPAGVGLAGGVTTDCSHVVVAVVVVVVVAVVACVEGVEVWMVDDVNGLAGVVYVATLSCIRNDFTAGLFGWTRQWESDRGTRRCRKVTMVSGELRPEATK